MHLKNVCENTISPDSDCHQGASPGANLSGEKNKLWICDQHSPPSTSQPSSPSSVITTFSCYLLVSPFLLSFGSRCRLGITPGVIHEVKEIWICVLSCAVPQLWCQSVSHWVLGMVDQKWADMVFRGRWSHDLQWIFWGGWCHGFFLDFPQHLRRQDFKWSNPAGRFFDLISEDTCDICSYTVNITWTVAWLND